MKSTVSRMYTSELSSSSAICVPTSVPIAVTNSRNDGDDAEQDQCRRPAPPPAPRRQPVDTGFDGEREEQRDQQQHHQPAEVLPQRHGGDGDEEAEPEQRDRRAAPSAASATRSDSGASVTHSRSVAACSASAGERSPRAVHLDALVEVEPAGHQPQLVDQLVGDVRLVDAGLAVGALHEERHRAGGRP